VNRLIASAFDAPEIDTERSAKWYYPLGVDPAAVKLSASKKTEGKKVTRRRRKILRLRAVLDESLHA
jgi:hypothetical protein